MGSRIVDILTFLTVVSVTVAAIVTSYSKNRQSGRYEKATADSSELGADMATSASTTAKEVASAAPPAPLTMGLPGAGSKALVVCPEGGEDVSVTAGWAAESRGSGAAVSVGPPDFLASHSRSAAGTYDIIVVEKEAVKNIDVLAEVLKLLKANGKAALVSHSTEEAKKSSMPTSPLERELIFAGFVNVSQSSEDLRVTIGQRPAWEIGASAPIRVSSSKTGGKKVTTSTFATSAHDIRPHGSTAKSDVIQKTWKLALEADAETDDLVDEEALLEASAPVVKRSTESDASGCATKRRACKDCSCGRAEMEAAGGGDLPRSTVALDTVDDLFTSSCGNCSKGDAFRCATCPFLGKPVFEKGQEKLILLSDHNDQPDE